VKLADHYDVAIRRAGKEDADTIESLYRELVSDSHIRVLPEQVAAISESATVFLLVAERNGIVCATALLNICTDVMYQAQPFGVIENVIVTGTMRGRGIGRLLLAHVEQLAFAHDCTKLMLLSSASRESAHSFFKRCGFADESKRGFVKYRRHFAMP
jgi:N-acetylglutamate synthase-like GNAT family acetyltransferase